GVGIDPGAPERRGHSRIRVGLLDSLDPLRHHRRARMSQSDIDLIRATYDAFGRGDIPAVMANFADDIEWNVPDVLPHGMRVRGHDGVGRFFAGLADLWSDFGLEIGEIVGSQ